MIPKNILSIDRCAFLGSKYLKNPNFHDDILRISHSAYENCDKISEITLPKNLKYLGNAMDVRSELNQFHPCSEMKCLSKGRCDIVVIKRGKGPGAVFAIHNMTENKINYQLNDNDLPEIIDNDFNMRDFLTSTKYNWKNISLDPFQVIWLSAL